MCKENFIPCHSYQNFGKYYIAQSFSYLSDLEKYGNIEFSKKMKKTTYKDQQISRLPTYW